jgi:hypothetical protein
MAQGNVEMQHVPLTARLVEVSAVVTALLGAMAIWHKAKRLG